MKAHTIAGHSRLAGNTGRDENNLSAGKTLPKSLWCGLVTLDSALGIDVADISGDTRSSTDIVTVSHSLDPLGRRVSESGIAHRASSVTRGLSFIKRERG